MGIGIVAIHVCYAYHVQYTLVLWRIIGVNFVCPCVLLGRFSIFVYSSFEIRLSVPLLLVISAQLV